MVKKIVLSSLLFSSCIAVTNARNYDYIQEYCNPSNKPLKIDIREVEGADTYFYKNINKSGERFLKHLTFTVAKGSCQNVLIEMRNSGKEVFHVKQLGNDTNKFSYDMTLEYFFGGDNPYKTFFSNFNLINSRYDIALRNKAAKDPFEVIGYFKQAEKNYSQLAVIGESRPAVQLKFL